MSNNAGRNEALAAAAKEGDQSALKTLWTTNQGLITQQVKKFSPYMEAEDARQECYFSLLHAVKSYDPKAGTAFSTYFCYLINGDLHRIISKNSLLPIGKNEKVISYRQTLAQLEAANGEPPTDQEAADAMQITLEELQEIRKADRITTPESLDAVNADGLTLADCLPDQDQNPEFDAVESAYRDEMAATVWNTVDTLEPDQKNEIRARYKDGKTLKEISQENGCTINATAGTERKALMELRNPRRAEKLRPFYDDIFSRATRGEGITSFERSWTSATERTALEDIGQAPDRSGTDP